jgi:hypothetical protein
MFAFVRKHKRKNWKDPDVSAHQEDRIIRLAAAQARAKHCSGVRDKTEKDGVSSINHETAASIQQQHEGELAGSCSFLENTATVTGELTWTESLFQLSTCC